MFQRLLIAIVLVCSLSITAYADELLICFEGKDSADIIVNLEKYKFCQEKSITQNKLINELTNKVEILEDLNDEYEFKVEDFKGIIKGKNDILIQQEEICEEMIIAASPTWGDRALWAGGGMSFSLLILLILL